MEIPPDSSIAQSTSLFSGRTKESILNSIATQYPVSENNPLIDSSNREVAISATNQLKDFKFDDFQEAYRMMNGPAIYPFQSIAQISNYKFDPFYFDGSENQPNFNVQENLIGTPLGTSLLEDPRFSYVKNLLTMKEYQGMSDRLNDSYIKELYMINSEKGSNYYINMLEKQDEALQNWSRNGRKAKSSEIDPISFTYNLPTGETQRLKPFKKIRVAQTSFSATPSVQRNVRQERFNTTTPRSSREIVNNTYAAGGLVTVGPNITPLPNTPLMEIQDQNASGIDSISPLNIEPLTQTTPQRFTLKRLMQMQASTQTTPLRFTTPKTETSTQMTPLRNTPGPKTQSSTEPFWRSLLEKPSESEPIVKRVSKRSSRLPTGPSDRQLRSSTKPQGTFKNPKTPVDAPKKSAGRK